MKLLHILSDIARIATIFIALFILLLSSKNPVIGAFIMVTAVLSFLLKFRRQILIPASRQADLLEFFAVVLIFTNALVLVFGKYEDPLLSYLDIPIHFFGGAVTGWWALLAFSRIFNESASFKNSFSPALRRNGREIMIYFLLIGAVALIGVGWEFFEWTVDHTLGIWFTLPRAQPSVNDVLSDILMDLLGGFAAVFFCSRFLNRGIDSDRVK